MRNGWILGSVLATVISVGMITGRAAGAAPAGDLSLEASVAQTVFSSVMPGAIVSAEGSATLPEGQPMPGMSLPAGDGLVVVVPAGELSASTQPGPDGRMATADAAWRLSMAAAFSASQLPEVTRFRLAGLTPSAPLQRAVGMPAILRLQPGVDPWAQLTRLDSVDQERLREQAASNVATIRHGFGDQVRSARLEVVPVSPDRKAVGLRLVFRVRSLEAVADRLGNALVGGQTGLVGGPLSIAEGTAVTVCDRSSCAASFAAARRQSGQMILPKGVAHAPMTTTVEFANLTGGPQIETFGHGGPASTSEDYIRARLEAAHQRLALKGIGCPESDGVESGCLAGPPVESLPTVHCPPGRRLVLRLRTRAKQVTAVWSGNVPFGDDPTLATAPAHASSDRRSWSLRVPAAARRANRLGLEVHFRGVGTTLQAKARCNDK